MINTDNLQKALRAISETGIVSIDDCPTDELDPEFERENVHRIIDENDIVDIVLEGYEKEESAIDNKEDDGAFDKLVS
jgi:hypothetical protein